ncbi:DUF1016 N-terminal domain-containing protein [uncultured Mailhella sp.]|uniref:DUF1016 N-terminal domain-containing protein n=1 Tax=uncultured Mailhella sp. TaxID=1981031 RepID=UPI00261A57B3|nr:DUF1016 N-terminal domain-containing protein [uncultured Mailhella sp.]
MDNYSLTSKNAGIAPLSHALNAEFCKGFSVDTLENTRKFYRCYQNRISETVLRKFVAQKSETLFRISDKPLPFTLSWSHYLQLMRIKNPEERRFCYVLIDLKKEKNDAVVEMTLPENSNIFASEYSLYLPDKKMLQGKLQEWIDEGIGGEDH